VRRVRRRRLAGLLGVIGIIGAAVMLRPTGGDPPPPPPTIPTTDPIVTTTPTPSPPTTTTIPQRGKLTADRKPVDPGIFDGTAVFRPSAKLQIKDGWKLDAQTPDLIEFTSTTHDQGHLQLVRVQRLYKPIALTSDEQALGALDTVPDLLSEWLTKHKFATQSSAKDIDKPEGASAAKEVDVTFPSGYAFPHCPDCVALFNLDADGPAHPVPYALTKSGGERTLFRVFVVGGTRVVLAISAPADKGFDAFRDEALQSFSILGFGADTSITSVELRSAHELSRAGETVAITAAVSGKCGPTGEVSFTDDHTLGQSVAVQDGAAVLDVRFDTPGTYHVLATYISDGNCTTSTSFPLVQTVTPP
jgi:hypothetical protein